MFSLDNKRRYRGVLHVSTNLLIEVGIHGEIIRVRVRGARGGEGVRYDDDGTRPRQIVLPDFFSS